MKNEKKKFYQKGWFLWLMLIFIPPIGIILLWACHKKMNKIIKIILSMVFAFWFLLLMIGLSGSGSDDENVPEEQKTQVESMDERSETNYNEGASETEENQVEDIETEGIKEERQGDAVIGDSSDKFVEDIENAIQWDIGEDETIEKVLYENGDLCVYVDLSGTDPAPLTYELLAESRTSSITDRILKFSQYDNLWDTITVDFGDVGYIRNAKDNIVETEYGRYFDPINFEIIHR